MRRALLVSALVLGAWALGSAHSAEAGPYEGCGDGLLAPHQEECDDGNTASCDGCDSHCRLVSCGNFVVQCDEECDDGNTVSCDGCSTSCRLECGNGSVECSELCDDGNTASCDGCEPSCQPAKCGNGVIDCCEGCDDGNTVSGDGCGSACGFDSYSPHSKDQVTCIEEMNSRGARVAQAQNADTARCLKAASRREAPFAACFGEDLAGRVGKASARTVKADTQRCGPPQEPDFAYTGASTVNDAATGEPLEMVVELFGAAPSLATASDKPAMRCQAELMKRAGALFDAVWSEANRAKHEALRITSTVPPVQTSAQLAGAIDIALTSSDRLVKVRDAVAKGLAKRCSGVPLGELFECDAPDPAALAACVIEAATRHAREAIEAADAIDFDRTCPRPQ